MAESNLVGLAWLGVVMVETQRVREEGNWVGVYNVCIEVVFSLFCKPTNGTLGQIKFQGLRRFRWREAMIISS